MVSQFASMPPLPIPTSALPAQGADRSDPDVYRVAAIPSCMTDVDEVILSDSRGHAYLMSDATREPTPLARGEADALGMFFEPSQDSSWHTFPELRRIFFGGEDLSASH